jgi:hypothetical protein
MKNVGDRSLLLGAVFVGFLIAALTWLFGVSPKLSAAASAQEAAVAQRDQNGILSTTLLTRQRDAALMPTYQRELYESRDALPPNEDIPSVRRLIDTIVTDAGLVVQTDHFSAPEPVPGGLSLKAQMEAVGLTSQIETLTFTNLIATEFGFEVVGSWEAVVQVIVALEGSDHRYLQMNNISVSSDTGNPGEVRAVLNGLFFTLDYGVPNLTVRPPERPWPGSEEGNLPPETQRNPFLPIAQ